MDKITPEQRSYLMSRIKGKNTKPEMRLRSGLHALGFRYRLHKRGLPGKPDLVFAGFKTAVFVNGCFWHYHEVCGKAHMPEHNRMFWTKKLLDTRARDIRNSSQLRSMGWHVITVWECEIMKDYDETLSKIVYLLHAMKYMSQIKQARSAVP